MAKKTLLQFEAVKEGEALLLKVKATKKLEELFKNLSESSTGLSGRWYNTNNEGLQFYTNNEKINEAMKKSVSYFDEYFFDDFGSGLIDGSRINVAILRAVGISEGLTMRTTELITHDGLKNYIEKLAQFSKDLYQNFLKKDKIKALVTFEI